MGYVDVLYKFAWVAMVGIMIASSLMIVGPPYIPTDNDDTLNVEYSAINGSFDIDFRMGDIEGYERNTFREYSAILTSNFFYTPHDTYVNQVYGFMQPYFEDKPDYVKAHYLLKFVQNNIDYRYDREVHGAMDYIQYPAETLLYKTGDCEDVAYLLYTLYRIAGLDAVLIHGDNHMSVGVYAEGLEGEYVTYLFSSRPYYIAEPTSTYNIGHDPITTPQYAFKAEIPPFATFVQWLIVLIIPIMFCVQVRVMRESRRTYAEAPLIHEEACQ